MSDTLSIGETGVFGCRFTRWSTNSPPRKIAQALTTISLVVTDPTGDQTTYAIGAFRNPETGRYELDLALAEPGTYVGNWTVTASWTDEDSNSRTCTRTARQEIVVAPT